MHRAELENVSLDELADRIAGAPAMSTFGEAARAELARRQLLLQVQATQAAKDTADYTRKSARYIFWSVVAIAVSSVATLVVNILKH